MNRVRRWLLYGTVARAPKDEADFRHIRFICGIGVGIACAAQLIALGSWPGTSNGLAPGKAGVFMAIKVIGGAALTWLILGVCRTLLSSIARRRFSMWFLTVANAIAALPILAAGYQ